MSPSFPVVPARAGVIPTNDASWLPMSSGSRASGGDPNNDPLNMLRDKWFPRERG